MDTQNNSNSFVKIIVVLLVVVVVVYAFSRFNPRLEDGSMMEDENNDTIPDFDMPLPSPPSPPSTTNGDSSESNGDITMERKYKDGTYTASGTYTSPAKQEQISIELTIKDDVVVVATFFENPSNPTTEIMQGRFKAGFKEFVVGKNVDEINIDLTVVNGSSLTPKGFMDALENIKVEASV